MNVKLLKQDVLNIEDKNALLATTDSIFLKENVQSKVVNLITKIEMDALNVSHLINLMMALVVFLIVWSLIQENVEFVKEIID